MADEKGEQNQLEAPSSSLQERQFQWGAGHWIGGRRLEVEKVAEAQECPMDWSGRRGGHRTLSAGNRSSARAKSH